MAEAVILFCLFIVSLEELKNKNNNDTLKRRRESPTI